MLLLICLEQLGICTHFGTQCRSQDGPPVLPLGGHESLTVHHEAIAVLTLGDLGLRWPASLCPFLGTTHRFYPIVEGVITPGVRRAASPSLPTTCIVGNGLLRVGGTGKPPRFNVPDVLCDMLGFFGLGGGVGAGRLLGQLAGMHHEKTEFGHVEAPVRVLHWHTADDALPMPTSRRLLASSSRFFQ
jgi:hypothetical protein